jgi:arabinogalactan oligomer / maltooligosaccharide transport system permease protein
VRRPSFLVVVGVHLGLLLFTIATLYPVAWVVKMALSPGQSFAGGASPIPTEVTLQNFSDVALASDANGWLFGRQLFNSVVVATATALTGLGLSTTAAYALSRWDFPGRDRGMSAFLVTQMFPGVVMAIPLYILLDAIGLLDTLAGLILVYATTSVPFATWTLKGYFDTIPRDLEEAALLDGASRPAGPRSGW